MLPDTAHKAGKGVTGKEFGLTSDVPLSRHTGFMEKSAPTIQANITSVIGKDEHPTMV